MFETQDELGAEQGPSWKVVLGQELWACAIKQAAQVVVPDGHEGGVEGDLTGQVQQGLEVYVGLRVGTDADWRPLTQASNMEDLQLC